MRVNSQSWSRALCAALPALLVACASSGSFSSSWAAPDAEPLQVAGSRVAAIAMIRDEPSRRAAEDALARELTARGAAGVPLYAVLPNARPDDEAAVRAAMEAAGVAGAVVMRPVETRTVVTVETLVYSLRQNRLVWGGQSRAPNTSSIDRIVRQTAAKAAKELERRGLIAS